MIRFKENVTEIECFTESNAKAFIWLSDKYYGLTFMCGDFTANDLEQILTKMKELQSEK